MNATGNLINKFVTFVIDPLMLVLFAAGFMLFMLGMVEFLLSQSKGGEAQKTGKDHMIYGVIGMLIMVSVGGIIAFLANTFGIDVSGNAVDTSSINNVRTGTFFR